MEYRPEFWALAVMAVTLAVAAVCDVRSGKIFNAVTYPAIAIGLIGQTLVAGGDGLATALGGLAAGFTPLLICWMLGGIGGGDAKLMAAVGALSNWRFALAAMAAAFIVAAIMALAVMVRKGIVVRTFKRIGRTLYLAVIPGAKGGWPDQTDSPVIPFGLALCVGSALAWLDSLAGGPLARGLLGG